jgi:sensor histidine kinase YesM
MWILVASSHAAVLVHFYGFAHIQAFVDSTVYYLLFGVLGVGLWYTVLYNDFQTMRRIDLLINHFGIAVVSLLVWFYAGYFILTRIYSDDVKYLQFINQSVPWRLGSGLFYYIFTNLFYYLLISYQNLQEKTKNEAELRTLVKETELNMLKAQINPHFLFNSLNSVSSLTITNPAKAQEMIIKLSEFLRRSIGHKDHVLTPLNQEIDHIMLYLDIEKVRFGDRLQYDFRVNDSCLNFPIPSMLLQPLFENAIKHGVYESTEEVTIRFRCEPHPIGLKINIINNFDPEAPPRKGNHMGIKNIINRLKIIYQYDDLLLVKKSERTFEVEILIPTSNSITK